MSKVLIIAEAGVNHNGDLKLAKKLVDMAYAAGADIIKFQTFKSANMVTTNAPTADYQLQNAKASDQYQMLKSLELSFQDFTTLKSYCDDIGIEFLSTGFDIESLNFLNSLNPRMWKIPSGEITNLPYLQFIGSLNKELILSTGMSTIEEIQDALNALKLSGQESDKITILHCTTDYPVPYYDINLNAMKTLQSHFNSKVGYSDHSSGIEISLAAVALGAQVIEKHFTLDRNMDGPDHKASLEPHELTKLVSSIRNIEVSLGNGIKIPTATEVKNIKIARKSIVAKKNISIGEKFTLENLDIKRPGTGISPMEINNIIGTSSRFNFKKDDIVKL